MSPNADEGGETDMDSDGLDSPGVGTNFQLKREGVATSATLAGTPTQPLLGSGFPAPCATFERQKSNYTLLTISLASECAGRPLNLVTVEERIKVECPALALNNREGLCPFNRNSAQNERTTKNRPQLGLIP